VKEYFQILQDTLVGSILPAYTQRPKRKVIHAPKFYYFDVALTNVLTKRKEFEPGSEVWGKAFENWIYHELKSAILYRGTHDDLAYWRLADSGREVDFILNDCEIAIEAKGGEHLRNNDLLGLRELKIEHPHVKERIIVCMEKKRRVTEDGIQIVPYLEFISGLWNKEWF
jgi:predicted AAA+ superfamily ATPase